jgi:hypothetical protein
MNNDPGPIPAFLDRTKLIGTYTILNTYKNCPHQMEARYIKKNTGPFIETPEMKWGNDVHSAFELRISTRKPLPISMAQWEEFAKPFDPHSVLVEQKLGIEADAKPTGFWDKDCWFRGKSDAAIIKDSTCYIADFKTGGSKYEDPFELEIGAVLLQAKYPRVTTIKGNYIWLKENRSGGMYDLSDTNATFAKMKRLMGEIERDRARGWFEKRQSGLCGWCPCSGCEHHFVARPK